MRTHRNTFYFPTSDAARAYATAHQWPQGRIISYERGWAIQLYTSGPYVGPTSEGERRHNALMSTRYGSMRA